MADLSLIPGKEGVSARFVIFCTPTWTDSEHWPRRHPGRPVFWDEQIKDAGVRSSSLTLPRAVGPAPNEGIEEHE
jgi:hypothetical protein